MKITKKELIKTAKELNELMGLDPAIPTAKDTEDSVLMEKIGEAAEMLEEDDEISEIAEEVIEYITEQQEEDDEQQEEDDEEEEQTTEQLIEASDYKGLKAMVADYPEFKGIDINIYPAKKIEDLRARMLRDLAKKAEKKAPEAAAAKKEEKPTAKKDTGKVAGKAVPKVGFTNTVDAIVKKGGSWEKLVEAINVEATKAQAKPWAIGQLKAHVRFRTKKNAAFFGKLNMTEKGMA